MQYEIVKVLQQNLEKVVCISYTFQECFAVVSVYKSGVFFRMAAIWHRLGKKT
jgi:hypothetical protein